MEYKFILDDSEIDAVVSEILCKFTYVKSIGLSKDIVLDADKYLKMIEQYNDEKRISAITHIRNTIIPQKYNKSFYLGFSNNKITYSQSSIMWEYVYVLARLYHYGESLWEKHFVPRMKELVGGSFFQEELQKADSRIEEYIKRRIEIIKAIQTAVEDKNTEQITPSAFRIAERRKTDVMKVLSYMFQLDCFANKDGQELKRQKTQFMIAIGKFFDCDFSNYAQIINKAAQEDHYNDIFIDMLDMAEKKILS